MLPFRKKSELHNKKSIRAASAQPMDAAVMMSFQFYECEISNVRLCYTWHKFIHHSELWLCVIYHCLFLRDSKSTISLKVGLCADFTSPKAMPIIWASKGAGATASLWRYVRGQQSHRSRWDKVLYVHLVPPRGVK